MQNQNIHYTRTIPTLLIALLLGCFGLSSAAQAAGRPSIVGLWDVHFFQGDTELFETHVQWHSDGLEFEINSVHPGAVCAGVYKTAANGTVHLFHVVFTYDANGVHNGRIDITQRNIVSDDGNTYSGTFDQKFYDLNGNFLFEATGTLTAVRLTVRP